jgi:hypothetical protein
VQGDLKAMRDHVGVLQSRHERIGDMVRASEDRVFKQAMSHPDIAEVRAIHGKHTEKVVRDLSLAKLKAKSEYIAQMAELGDIQNEIESLQKAIAKADQLSQRLKDEAQAQSLQAGETLKQIQELEKVLNA